MPAALPFTNCITCGDELKRSNIVRGNCMTCHKRIEYQTNEIIRQRVISNTRKWQKKNPNIIQEWKLNNIERVRENERTRYKLNPQRFLQQDKSSRETVRHTAMLIVGHGVLRCVNCGCNREDLLQINHINGGGSKERRDNGGNGTTICYRIASGQRLIDDLELRCYPCNALHAIEIKHGKLPIKIVWGGDE